MKLKRAEPKPRRPDLAVPLPHADEAERCVLGAMLTEGKWIAAVRDILDAEDFYLSGNQICFEAIMALDEAGGAVDLVTLKNELARRGSLDDVGGAVGVSMLLDGVHRATNAEMYAAIVRGKSAMRKVVRIANEAIKAALSEERPVEEIIAATEQGMLQVLDGDAGGGGLRSFKEVGRGLVVDLERQCRQEGVAGIATGFKGLDRTLGGLMPGDLILLAGRPSMGKTAAGLDIARHVAQTTGPVAFFSLEMTAGQLARRVLSAEAKVDGKRLRDATLDDGEWGSIIAAIERVVDMPLWIDDCGTQTLMTVRSRSMRMQRSIGLSLVVVDYLQLMSQAPALSAKGRQPATREQDIATVSRGLKALAKELGVPVLALAQLSRMVDGRSDHRPRLSDLRESGSLEQDADTVVFVFREEQYEKTEENAGRAEFIVGKQRNGPTGSVEVLFLEEYSRFEDMPDFPRLT